MTVVALKPHISAATAKSVGGQVRVLKGRVTTAKPKISEKTRRTFQAISSPDNARLFTLDAALAAFSHIKV